VANQRFRGSAPSSSSEAQPPRSARSAALALLSRRDYSTYELQQKLTDRGFDDDAIEDAVADLGARGFVDDRRVAAAHVRTASKVKGRGRIRIARELAARGIARDVIDEAVNALEPGEAIDAIRRILQRKRWPAKPSLVERQKMFRHLLGRGFPAETISRALGRSPEEE